LDIFSPLPGDSEVTSQFERESSSEMKIAASLTSMAAWTGLYADADIVASRLAVSGYILLNRLPLSTGP
jgi:hypothetical protein